MQAINRDAARARLAADLKPWEQRQTELEELIRRIDNGILQIHGISQNPDTKDYVFVLEYAGGGNFDDWMKRNYKAFDWSNKILVLSYIIKGIENLP